MKISFGDNVKILSSPDTDARGLSGKIGQVFGETTPSVTSVEVIGESAEDYALNVSIAELGQTFWFSPQLLEFVDHGAGTEIEIGNQKAVRRADGTWEEFELSPRKIWWKLW